MIGERGGEGKRAGRQCQAARGVGVASRRGSGGGGKRVNRESTCKQATRETNNVGAAGCSPNEAGRLVRFVAVRSVSRPRQSVARHRVFDLSNRARARRESNRRAIVTAQVRGSDSKTRRNSAARRGCVRSARRIRARPRRFRRCQESVSQPEERERGFVDNTSRSACEFSASR